MIASGERRRLLAIGAAGILLFVAGVFLACSRLPEWRVGAIPRGSFFAARLRESVARAGIQLHGNPRARLTTVSTSQEELALFGADPVYEILGTEAVDWLTREGRGPYVEENGNARWGKTTSTDARIAAVLSLRGEPVSAVWSATDALVVGESNETPPLERSEQLQSFARIFAPQANLANAERIEVLGQQVFLLPISTGPAAETLTLTSLAGSRHAFGVRNFGSVAYLRQRLSDFDVQDLVIARLGDIIAGSVLVLGTIVLFFVLLARRRIALGNGAILGGLTLLLSVGDLVHYSYSWLHLIDKFADALGWALAVLVLWSAAESWVRSTVPGFRTSLDSLRSGRVGPHSGLALLCGGAMGAAVAGVSLIAATVATYVPGLALLESTVPLPVFRVGQSPLSEGVVRAGVILLAIAASLKLPLIRRVPFAGALIGAGLLATRLDLAWFWVAFIVAFILTALLIFTYTRFGMSALLVASVVSLALPAAVYAARHPHWLMGSMVAAGVLVALPLTAGLAGLRKEEEPETGRTAAPAFVRRIEEESRVKYEMDLLARMQTGLLPRETPAVNGYELAARSVLATEVGGDLYDFLEDEDGEMWIAAGDVSGHGYSCAIAQAMTKAGLASLVRSGKTPAYVLGRLDRVLRGSGSQRTFTSLVLMKFNPASGQGVIANAGHPYPLLASDGSVRELVMPSLPLGQGPARTYADQSLALCRGDVMVFSSDGLFEALNREGSPYGYDRIRELMRSSRDLSAEKILDSILTDWRRHAGPEAPLDDTTIVVLKRKQN